MPADAPPPAPHWPDDTPLLHVLPQAAWHDCAHIIGTRDGLLRLRAAIDAALAEGAGVADGVFPTDGEGYWCIVLRASGAQMEDVPLGYTDEIAASNREIPAWAHEAGARAVQKLLAARAKGGGDG